MSRNFAIEDFVDPKKTGFLFGAQLTNAVAAIRRFASRAKSDRVVLVKVEMTQTAEPDDWIRKTITITYVEPRQQVPQKTPKSDAPPAPSSPSAVSEPT